MILNLKIALSSIDLVFPIHELKVWFLLLVLSISLINVLQYSVNGSFTSLVTFFSQVFCSSSKWDYFIEFFFKIDYFSCFFPHVDFVSWNLTEFHVTVLTDFSVETSGFSMYKIMSTNMDSLTIFLPARCFLFLCLF